MDYEMKRMNGFDATRQIVDQFPEARVVIVSQWDSPSLRDAAKESGAMAYVNKKSLVPLRDIIEAG
jgi:NarL family two-component system response regulator LiaR